MQISNPQLRRSHRVACPYCGARIGYPCVSNRLNRRTYLGDRAKSHPERLAAANRICPPGLVDLG